MSKPPPSGGIKLPAPPPKGGAPPPAAKKPPPGTPPAAAAAAAASTPPGTPPVAKKGPPPAVPPPIPQKKGPPPALPKKEPALPPKLPSKVSEARVSDPSLSMPLPEPPMNIPLPTPPVKAHEIPLPTPPAVDESHEEDSDASEVSESEPVVETLAEKRFKIVNEILSTEKTYVAALDYMVNSYLHPLLLLAETELLPTRSKSEIRCIFSNVEQLLPINRHLYQSVEDRIKNWSETQLIGDIFLKMAPFFKMYNLYSNNYDAASNMLDKCKQDENFVQAVDKIASTIDHVGLESMLIMPIQRVPRYNLLLSDLLRKTNENHPDFSILKQALETMENVMQYLDNNITEAENIKKFLAMSKMRGGNRLIQAHRVLITEGVLHIKSKKQSDNTTGTIKKRLGSFKIKEAQLQIWLFNDVLVHLKTTKSKRKTDVASTEYTWPLELIWLKDIKDQDPHDPKMPFSFVLVGPRKTYSLRFPSMDEKLKWMNTIKSAVSKVLNEENAPDDLHRYGHYKFPKDGGEYEGWWKFGRIHGEGVFKFFGNKYTGEWEYNSKCGTGTFECVTGEVYHGEWKEDRPNGYGQLHYTNKDYYDGEWRVGVRAGKGVLLYANGDKYDGEWRENVPCGEGTYTTVTGFIYTGGWLQGKPNGFGCLIAPNGRRFEGQFKEGMKTGEGKMDYANGDFYIGQWKEDKPQGFGIYHSAVEGLYEGMFHNGLKEGQGKMLFKNGDIFEGQWKRNLFHGSGVLVSSSGALEKYDGQWENGKLSGKGVLFYRSGARYEGQFKDDRLHGNGIYISANAVVFDGKWVDGRREGKAVIAVGPSKFTSSVVGGIMAEGEKSFLVVPDVPAIHLEL